jgi:hypothetical protein
LTTTPSDPSDSFISGERVDLLRKRVYYAYNLLKMTSDELLMSVDDDLNLGILAEEIHHYTWKILDLTTDRTEL